MAYKIGDKIKIEGNHSMENNLWLELLAGLRN